MAHTDPHSASISRDGSSLPLVVGLGASAGGIKALSDFFRHLPAQTGNAYVVILHLSPDDDSKLAEVLQAITPLPVGPVAGTVEIAPNRVYVVPPNKALEIADGQLVASDITRLEQRRAPVDLFFRTLADAYGPRAVCIVLSGTGPNGSGGLKRVKEYGGLVIAQDPAEAEYDGMPTHANATGLVDLVLPVSDMPGKIAEYAERLKHVPSQHESHLAPHEGEAMWEVLTLLRARTGHDFSNYKRGTLQRRVERRLHLRGLANVASYARVIREQPDEAVALMKELLISVTSFFRDPPAWEALAAHIPAIFRDKTSHEQVRVWVAGCATGEEAYSVAMLLAEHTQDRLEKPSIQVFATDLDDYAIATAREGFYTAAEIADLPEKRLHRFFQPQASGFRVRRELREVVLFAHHNVIKDPPFSHLDLVACRNLLICLNRTVQQRVLETFHFALRPRGLLFLGSSESPDGARERFVAVDKTARIFETRNVGSRLALPLVGAAPTAGRLHGWPGERPAERIMPAELHQRLLEQYAPPSIVVTDEHTVVHVSDRASRYLRVGGGEPSRELMRLLRPDLRADVRAALHQAAHDRANVEVHGIPLSLEGGTARVSVSVRPIPRQHDPATGFFLILFDETDTSETEGTVLLKNPAEPVTRQAEELARVRAQLRATVEEYETQVEQANASHEELQAMNEELMAAAEELETRKEELQSVNEELATVNQELKVKIEELGAANNDFQNLINSSEAGTIFLDRDLRVKLSTPAARRIFNLLSTDTGRPLSDITNRLLYDRLQGDVREVLQRLETINHEVQTRDGSWHLMRVRPYRTLDDRIDGVVITFQDITQRRLAEARVREGEERLRLLIDGATDYAIFTLNLEGRIDSWNSGAERMFGYRADEILGRSVDVLFTAEDRAAGVPAAEIERARLEGRASDERSYVRKDGARFPVSSAMTHLGADAARGFTKIARDLTYQQRAAEALAAVHASLEARVRDRTGELEIEVRRRATAQDQATTLLRMLVSSQEEERARIARDLHDLLGQQLTALRLVLERSMEHAAGRATALQDLEQALELTRRLDDEVGFLSWQLRPSALDDLGLTAALPRFVAEWSGHYGISAEFRASSFEGGQLSREAEVAFYRIAQEALNNVVKHAHAARAEVLLETRDSVVTLLVEDDGIGFDPEDGAVKERGLGLVGMRERAGLIGATLQIESSPGKGTSIFLRCPMRAARDPAEATR